MQKRLKNIKPLEKRGGILYNCCIECFDRRSEPKQNLSAKYVGAAVDGSDGTQSGGGQGQ